MGSGGTNISADPYANGGGGGIGSMGINIGIGGIRGIEPSPGSIGAGGTRGCFVISIANSIGMSMGGIG